MRQLREGISRGGDLLLFGSRVQIQGPEGIKVLDVLSLPSSNITLILSYSSFTPRIIYTSPLHMRSSGDFVLSLHLFRRVYCFQSDLEILRCSISNSRFLSGPCTMLSQEVKVTFPLQSLPCICLGTDNRGPNAIVNAGVILLPPRCCRWWQMSHLDQH